MKQPSTAYNTTPLWEPVFVLPSQLPARGSYFNSPEMHLVAAIFEDAVHTVRRYAGVRRGRRTWYEFLEARDWILDDRRDWPFAFANVCELLSLDIAAVRESLQESLAERHARRDTPRDEPPREPQGWNAPGDEHRVPRDGGSAEHERFQVVVWDEA